MSTSESGPECLDTASNDLLLTVFETLQRMECRIEIQNERLDTIEMSICSEFSSTLGSNFRNSMVMAETPLSSPPLSPPSIRRKPLPPMHQSIRRKPVPRTHQNSSRIDAEAEFEDYPVDTLDAVKGTFCEDSLSRGENYLTDVGRDLANTDGHVYSPSVYSPQSSSMDLRSLSTRGPHQRYIGDLYNVDIVAYHDVRSVPFWGRPGVDGFSLSIHSKPNTFGKWAIETCERWESSVSSGLKHGKRAVKAITFEVKSVSSLRKKDNEELQLGLRGMWKTMARLVRSTEWNRPYIMA